VLGGGEKKKSLSHIDADADWSRPVHTSTVRSKQNRCAFHNHDSYGLGETCAELGSVISLSHELCLVVAKKQKITPILLQMQTGRGPYTQALFGQNKIAVRFTTTIAMESGRPALNSAPNSLSSMSCAWWWRKKKITLPTRWSYLPDGIAGAALAALRIYRMVTRQAH
jgi:hypothetical protein